MSAPNRKNGYFIIEAVVGISIVVIALLGVIGLLTQSLSLNRLVSDQHVANGLAMEGIELVKNLVDRNCILNNDPFDDPGDWNEIVEDIPPQGKYADGDYEIDYDSEWLVPTQNRYLQFSRPPDPSEPSRLYGIYSYDSGDETKFKRTIKIDVPSGSGAAANEEMRVRSIVTWKSRGQDFSIELEDHFFNWWPSCPL